MQRALLIFALLVTPTSLHAEQAVPSGHSTVHIVFIVPNTERAQLGGASPMARVGDVVVPVDSLTPISVRIDDEFVGHAMVGYQDVDPVFVLPSGTRKFTFTGDGLKTASAKLEVLGTGSKQFLIVKLMPASEDSPTFSKLGYNNRGNEVGVPTESIDAYAEANGISRSEAAKQMLAERNADQQKATGN